MLTVTDKGITTETLPEILSRMSQAFRDIYGADIDLSPDTPDGQLLGVFSQELANCNDVISAMVRMLNPYTATGRWLTDRSMYAGIVRRGAKHTYCNNVQIKGKQANAFKVGDILTDSLENKWEITEVNSINATESKAIIKSVTAGVFNLIKGDILTPELIVGVITITVTEQSVGGAEEESDEELLIRFMKSHSINNFDDWKGIKAQVLSIDDIYQAEVYENFTGKTDAKGVPAHSVNVVVDGGDDNDIALAILKKKKGGCGLFGKQKVTIHFEDAERDVYFDRAVNKEIKVVVTIKRIRQFTDIDEDKIKQALSDLNFAIGQSVYANNLICSIPLPDSGGFVVQSITVNGAASVDVDWREVPVVRKNQVEVNIV